MNDTPVPMDPADVPTDGWVDIEEAMPGGRYDGIFEENGLSLSTSCHCSSNLPLPSPTNGMCTWCGLPR